MKVATLVTVFALVTPATLFAQPGDMKGMDMQQMDMKGKKSDGKKADAQVHKATGKITKVDASTGAVTIAHEQIESLKWPAMTMAFKVKDKSVLEKAKPGAKIDFSFISSGKDYVITDIK